MAHAEEQEESNTGRSQPHNVKERGPLHSLSSRFQRKLKKVKLPTPSSAKQDASKTTGHVQAIQPAGFVEKKNQLNLTVATTDSTCTCTSSRSQNPYNSYEYSISSSNQQACSQINSDSMETFESSGRSPNVPSDVDLFSEWLQLHARSSGEKATTDTYDEADEQEDFFPFRATTAATYQYPREIEYESRNEPNEMIYFDSQRELNEMIYYESRRELDEMINYWSPRDLLSDTYSHSLVSPTDTAAATNNHIPTPPASASASCSFNFDLFGLSMFKSVGESVSQIKARIEGEDGESTDSDDDDDSSCTLNSC